MFKVKMIYREPVCEHNYWGRICDEDCNRCSMFDDKGGILNDMDGCSEAQWGDEKTLFVEAKEVELWFRMSNARTCLWVDSEDYSECSVEFLSVDGSVLISGGVIVG